MCVYPCVGACACSCMCACVFVEMYVHACGRVAQVGSPSIPMHVSCMALPPKKWTCLAAASVHTGIAHMHIHMHTHAVKPFSTCVPWHCMKTHTHATPTHIHTQAHACTIHEHVQCTYAYTPPHACSLRTTRHTHTNTHAHTGSAHTCTAHAHTCLRTHYCYAHAVHT